MATDVFIFGCQQQLHNTKKFYVLLPCGCTVLTFCVSTPTSFSRRFNFSFHSEKALRGPKNDLGTTCSGCCLGKRWPDSATGARPRHIAPHHARLNGRVVQGARLKFESLRRRGFEPHFNHFCTKSLRTTGYIFLCRLRRLTPPRSCLQSSAGRASGC